MLTRIEHPCVLYDYIILDFLQVPVGTRRSKSGLKNSQRYQTWSPAYTVSSIMIQLQGNQLPCLCQRVCSVEVSIENTHDIESAYATYTIIVCMHSLSTNT